MSTAEEQACADTLAAIRRWLALRLARLESSPPTVSGVLFADTELKLDPNLQAAMALTHIYEEVLRLASVQRTAARRPVGRVGFPAPAQKYDAISCPA